MKNSLVRKYLPVCCLLATGLGVNQALQAQPQYGQRYGDFPPASIDQQLQGNPNVGSQPVERQPQNQKRNSDDQTAQRSGDTDVEQRFAVAHRRSLRDDRAHRPDDTKGHRDKVGQADRRTVPPGDEIVAQFVGQQNAQQRGREGDAPMQMGQQYHQRIGA